MSSLNQYLLDELAEHPVFKGCMCDQKRKYISGYSLQQALQDKCAELMKLPASELAADERDFVARTKPRS